MWFWRHINSVISGLDCNPRFAQIIGSRASDWIKKRQERAIFSKYELPAGVSLWLHEWPARHTARTELPLSLPLPSACSWENSLFLQFPSVGIQNRHMPLDDVEFGRSLAWVRSERMSSRIRCTNLMTSGVLGKDDDKHTCKWYRLNISASPYRIRMQAHAPAHLNLKKLRTGSLWVQSGPKAPGQQSCLELRFDSCQSLKW